VWADERKRFYRVLMLDEPEQYHAMIHRLAGASSAAAINNRGLAHAEIGDLDEALEDFATAIAIDPDAAVPHINRGDLRKRQGRLAAAIEDYAAGIAREPNDPRFRRTRAVALHEIGRYDEAVAEYDAAIRLDPDSELSWTHKNRDRAAARMPPSPIDA